MVRDTFTDTTEPLPVMLWRARPDMSCEHLSRQWLEFTGVAEDQALGDGWSRSVHPEDLARWLDTCLRAFDAREPYEIEYRLRRRDGEYRWVLDRAMPRYSRDGVFLGFLGGCIDIDDRKHAEQELARSLERERKLRIAAEEAGRLKDGFFAGVLADLQPPVRTIAAQAAELRGQLPSGNGAGTLHAIEESARAQDRMLSSLLDLARLGNGSPPVARGTTGAAFLSGVRVLIVEHDPAARESIANVLGTAGAETRAAGSSAEALDALRVFRPDVMLSEVDGSNGDAHVVVRGVHAGSDAQLAKPVEPVALLAAVARLAHPASM